MAHTIIAKAVKDLIDIEIFIIINDLDADTFAEPIARLQTAIDELAKAIKE